MNARTESQLAEVLRNVLTSPNVSDSNGEPANLVDVFDEISRCLWFSLAPERGMKRVNAIEAYGTMVKEAAETIGGAIRDLAEAIREHGQPAK